MKIKAVFPIVVGSGAGIFSEQDLIEAGIPAEAFVRCEAAKGVISHLVAGSQQLVIIDTGARFGITDKATAEEWILSENPDAEVIHIDGWASCRQHFKRIQSFIRALR